MTGFILKKNSTDAGFGYKDILFEISFMKVESVLKLSFVPSRQESNV
jgi:hypothetical protein